MLDDANRLKELAEWGRFGTNERARLIVLVRDLIERLPDDDPPVEFNVGSTDD